MSIESRIIAVDFDGTVVVHQYPKIGPRVHGALEVLRDLESAGHRIILLTMRSEQQLDEAVQWMNSHSVNIWAVNHNPEQAAWTTSPKVYAHIYIDDAALGCPTKPVWGERPVVDWLSVRDLLKEKGVLP